MAGDREVEITCLGRQPRSIISAKSTGGQNLPGLRRPATRGQPIATLRGRTGHGHLLVGDVIVLYKVDIAVELGKGRRCLQRVITGYRYGGTWRHVFLQREETAGGAVARDVLLFIGQLPSIGDAAGDSQSYNDQSQRNDAKPRPPVRHDEPGDVDDPHLIPPREPRPPCREPGRHSRRLADHGRTAGLHDQHRR